MASVVHNTGDRGPGVDGQLLYPNLKCALRWHDVATSHSREKFTSNHANLRDVSFIRSPDNKLSNSVHDQRHLQVEGEVRQSGLQRAVYTIKWLYGLTLVDFNSDDSKF